MKLLKTSLATAVTWEMVRYLSPVEIPERIAPFIVAGLGFGVTFLDDRTQLALASAGGAVIFHKMTDATNLEPLTLPRPGRKRTKNTHPVRIPRL